MQGSDSVPSLRAAGGEGSGGGVALPMVPEQPGLPDGLLPYGCGALRCAGVPGAAAPIPSVCRRSVPPASVPGGRQFGGDAGRSLEMPRGSGTGENPVTSPAAGPGWEGSFSGQRRAAAPPPLGWRWGYPFLTPLHPVNHATVIRGLCGARANPQSHSTCSRYFNFMPLAPGGNFSHSASPGEVCVPGSASSSPCPIPEARHRGGEHPASAAAKELRGPGWRRGT